MGLKDRLADWRDRLARRGARVRVEHLQKEIFDDAVEGRLQQAAARLFEARQLSLQWLGEDSTDAIERLRDVANNCFQSGEKELARDVCWRWLVLLADQLERGLPYPECLQHLEEILLVVEDYDGMTELLQVVAQELRQREGQERTLHWVLRGLALVAKGSMRMTEAEPFLREAVALWEERFGPAGKEYDESLTELADVLFINGHDREAAELLERSLEVARAGPDAPGPVEEAIRILVLAGLYLWRLGDFARAEPLIQRADQLLRQAAASESLSSTPVERWKRLLHMSGEHQAMLFSLLRETQASGQGWRPERAYPVFEEIAARWSPLMVAEAQLLIAQMGLAASLGQTSSIFEDDSLSQDFFASLEPLFEMEEEEEELPHEEQLLEMLRSLDPASPLYDRHLDQLVEQRGDSAAAAKKEILRTAVARRAEVLGESHPQTAYARYKLAEYLDRRGEPGTVEPLLREALEAWRRLPERGSQRSLPALRALAGLCAATGRDEEAWRLLLEAADLEHRLIASVFSSTSEEQRRSFLQNIEETYVRSLAVAWKLGGRTPALRREAFGLVLRRKGLVTRAQLAQWESSLRATAPALAGKIEELGVVRQQIADRILSGGAVEDDEGEDEALTALEEARARLEAELARAAAGSALAVELGAVELDDLCGKLPAESVLVEIVRLNTDARGTFEFKRGMKPRYLAFILPAGELDGLRMVDLGAVFEVSDAITRVHHSIAGTAKAARDIALPQPPPDADVETAAAWLQQTILAPILDAAGGRTRLLISPDGELSLLPFEILPDGAGGHLIDRYSVSYLSSGRELLRFGTELSREPDPPAVIAAPDYDLGLGASTGSVYFRPLRHAAAEGRQVARWLGVEPWTGAAAVESRMRGLRSPHILHLATHGFLFDSPNPFLRQLSGSPLPARLRDRELREPLLYSGVALAGANAWLNGQQPPPEAGDGLLTAAEVATLHLVDTELVVLSACSTGLGQVQTGEGVMGLRRSFTMAGARTLVISLSEVPDRETRQLMAAFYSHLQEGRGRAEALRLAQLELKARNPDPVVWGTFICQGDPGPLRHPLVQVNDGTSGGVKPAG